MRLNPRFENREEVILRDFLALERTRLANERTLLSYIRSSLYLVLGGIALLQLKDFTEIRWLGYFSLGLSVIFVIVGITRFIQLHRTLRDHYFDNHTRRDTLKSESDE